MPTIEQVSKRVFSDSDWLKKIVIGCIVSLVPLVQILALGYLYRIFLLGRGRRDFELPQWDDWQGLLLDGLRFLVVSLVFAALPIGLIYACSEIAFDGLMVRIPLIPLLFIAGPLLSAALYLHSARRDIGDCFSVVAIRALLTEAAPAYAVPTLAYLGLNLLCLGVYPLLPFSVFAGGVVYFYIMGIAYSRVEASRRA